MFGSVYIYEMLGHVISHQGAKFWPLHHENKYILDRVGLCELERLKVFEITMERKIVAHQKVLNT